ncbi:MAG TPA: DUF2155 domain-containing protein [Roseiarcus sp.]|nr:DUF2155 domain-containing protein [Roseiarcus sp.]
MTAWQIRRALFAAGLGCVLLGFEQPANADKIKNPTAVFSGLDKITGRIISFEAAIDETVQFGSLQITPRVCYTRPPTEAPQTDVFAEVDEVGENNEYKRVFTGWMFAASPGLHGIEHPVYDIWLNDCKGGTEVIHTAPEEAELPADANPPDASQAPAPNNSATPAAAPKKRKPKPTDAALQGDSLDPSASGQSTPRRTPTQRYYPADASAPSPAPASGGNFFYDLFHPKSAGQ